MRGALAACALAFALASCREAAVEGPIDAAWRRGAAWLCAQQASDGAFRSDAYGILKPGWSTTAIALFALSRAPAGVRAQHARAIERGFAFLANGIAADGSIGASGSPVDYPCYTAAFHLLALGALRPEGWRDIAERQVAYLRRAQCVEARGWAAADPAHGGFGYGTTAAPKPAGEDSLNVSVTAWVLAGLRAVEVARDDAVVRAALGFVERCRVADGGFCWSPLHALGGSKAGDADGVPRGYGTATADGLHALLAAGVPRDDPRVQGALAWLRSRFALEPVPGFGAERGAYEAGLRTYWLAAASAAFEAADAEPESRRRIAHHACALQRADGSWVGASAIMKEDDTLVATTLALTALGAGD